MIPGQNHITDTSPLTSIHNKVSSQKWYTGSVTKILLLTLGSILFCSILIILLATAITHTNWYTKRRRSFQRRLEPTNRTNIEIGDKIINFMCITVETLSISFSDDYKCLNKSKKISNIHKINVEKAAESSSLPLRFQPEKLYGATTTVHRDNLRKSSYYSPNNLTINDTKNRRKSMFDGFTFNEVRKNSNKLNKSIESSNFSPNNMLIQHSHISNSNDFNINSNQSKYINTKLLTPLTEQTNIYLIQPKLESKLSYPINDSNENFLTVPIIPRRASATDYELFDSRTTNMNKLINTPVSITITDTHSDIENSYSLSTRKSSLNSPATSNLFPNEYSKSIRRNSFLSYCISSADKQLCNIDKEKSLSSSQLNKPLSNSTLFSSQLNITQLQNNSDSNISIITTNTNIITATTTTATTLASTCSNYKGSQNINTITTNTINENFEKFTRNKNNKLLLLKKLPTIPNYEWIDYPAGLLALKIECYENKNSNIHNNNNNNNIEVNNNNNYYNYFNIFIYAAKNLVSPRLWHKSTYTVRINITNIDLLQTYAIHCKEAEFGCPQFMENEDNFIHVLIPNKKFKIINQDSNQSDLVNEHLIFKINESIPKWSGDKEFYHGCISIPISQILRANKNQNTILWYPIEEAYPIVRTSGDLLVSICRNHLKGFVNVGIHEIRNLKFESLGKWRIEDLNTILLARSIEVSIHACLVHAGHIVKTVKVISLNRPYRKLSKIQSHYHQHQPNQRYSIQTCDTHDRTSGTSVMNSTSSTNDIDPTTRTNEYHEYPEKSSQNILLNNDCYVQFSLPTMKKSFGKHLSGNYGIILYVTSKLPISDLIPFELINQLKQLGINDIPTIHATGQCVFGDPGFQGELVKDPNRPQTNYSQNIMFWDEAGTRSSTRIYQWLNME